MRKKIVVFTIGILTTLVFLLFTWNAVFKHFAVLPRVNHIFYDINLKLFNKNSSSDNVVIVDIDEKSLQEEGRWPWSRDKSAVIVKNLQKAGAAVIGFDILFPEPEQNIVNTLLEHARQEDRASSLVINYLSDRISPFDIDKKFAEAIGQGDVVLGVFFSDGLYKTVGKLGKPILKADPSQNLFISKQSKFIGNIPILANAVKYTGFTTTTPDEDGAIRRSPLLIEHKGGIYPSLGLEAARAYLLIDKVSFDLRDLDANKIFLGINLGDTYIPTNSSGGMLINYPGPAFSFPYVSAADVFNNRFSPDDVEGKVVLIGSSAVGIGDLHSTPMQAVGYPGTEVHASITASILDRNMISSPLWLVGIERILIVAVGLIATVLAAYFPALLLIILTIFMLGLLFMLNAVLLSEGGLVLPRMVLPYLQVLFLGLVNSGLGYLFETRSRRKLHDVYGQYVSSTYIDKMLKNNDQHTMSGKTKVMTVLFADIKSFTSISEKLEGRGVKKFLNTLFTPITEIIFESKGTIDKYVGDMVMAFWNDPIADENHALHCVEAALKMQKKVKELAPTFAALNLNDVALRIGINTGMMHVGDMGSEYRKAYTVLGDAVNLASRLEGVNKMYGTRVLVSEETKDACDGVIFRFIDCIYVKGKDKPTNIYEPLYLASEKTTSLDQELAHYEKALDLYNADDWLGAKKEFEQLAAEHPEVDLYSVYLKRVSEYELSPPPPGWDHGQHLTQK